MKIEPHWRRISGINTERDGTVGVVWLAYDQQTGVVRCYDVALFRRQMPAVVAEGITARGRYYPMAWRNKDQAYVEPLKKRGIKVLPDPSPDGEGVREAVTAEIWQKLNSNQFRVLSTVGEWLNEYRTMKREKATEEFIGYVPENGFPLMAATRHAVQMLPFAKAERMQSAARKNYPDVQVL